MRRKSHEKFGGPWRWCAVVTVLCVAVGIWNADEQRIDVRADSLRDETSTEQVASPWADGTRLELIESTLAQAGCPGWIVLAEEGESALQPPADLVPDDIQPTAHHEESDVPTVRYPVPVRVASRTTRIAALSAGAAVSIGSASAPDDLLDGVPDLLAEPQDAEPQDTVEEAQEEPRLPEQSAIQKPENQQPEERQPEKQLSELKLAPWEPELDQPDEEQPVDEPPVLKILPPVEIDAETTIDVLPPVETTPAVEQPSFEELPLTQATPAEGSSVEVNTADDNNDDDLLLESPVQDLTLPGQKLPDTSHAPVQQTPALQEQLLPGPTETESFAPPARPQLTQPESIQRPQPQQPATQSPFAPPPATEQSTPHSVGSGQQQDKQGEAKTYCEFVAENNFPSAHVCAKCHEKIFDEWSVSSHAYAMVSPMFHKFEQKINDLSQGTVGYFCYRCHSPVGTTLGISRAAPLWQLPQVAREGVTCVACHRVNQRYGKVNGERRIEPGDIHAPVYGSIGGSGVAEVIAKKDHYKVKTSPHEKGPGQDMHVAGMCFDQLSKAEFCMSCHQVAVHPGIKLEVVWEQYRASPACKKGVSCQDCHMGRIPGVPSGYETGSAAKVNDKVVNPNRKHANHVFYGPGYSIAHPGVFPHNKDALRWTMQDWLLFDWRGGWGTEKFEELVDAGRVQVSFPKVWAEADDRYDAREIIDDNFKKLGSKNVTRQQVLENGSHVDGPYFDTPLARGQELKFHYLMTNTNDGHNLPTGSLGAQPQMWANVVLIGPRGQRLWESGYTDRWGDVADIHSEDVRNKILPYDWQLFNLQTMFLITGAKGTDREFFLPVNIDFDQLPYLRPGAQPITTINHPPFIRMEGRSLAPLGSRKIPYKVPAHLMCEPGQYRLSFRLRSRAEPIYFMRFCGSTTEMNRAMNEGMVDFHQSSVEFFVK